jgi:hypothetical protein
VRTRTRTLGAALTALAALVAGAASLPAVAAGQARVSGVTLTDPTGDVWAIGEGESEESQPAGDEPTADVVRAVVKHRRHSLLVRMTFTDLRRVDPAFYSAVIVTPDKFRGAFVGAEPRRWKGRHILVDGRFDTVRCAGFEHTIDYAMDRVTMSIPRRCLGSPRWVRVSLDNWMFRGESEETFLEISDNPHNTGAESGMTRRLYRAG